VSRNLASTRGTSVSRWSTSIKHWAGYGWFVSFGTILALMVFLASYLVHLTLVGPPVARAVNRFGIWLSTFGQEPPGKDRLESRPRDPNKKSFVERIRKYSPPRIIERRDRPFSSWQPAVWFVLVGWWLGAIWFVVSWSVFFAPYPFLDTVRDLLNEPPSVMALARPEHPNGRLSSGEGGSLTSTTE
jgi:uncharacterized membrane protein YccF (DUF307 family)